MTPDEKQMQNKKISLIRVGIGFAVYIAALLTYIAFKIYILALK